MHGTINGTGSLAIAFLVQNNDLYTGITGVSGFIVLVVINLMLFVLNKMNLVKL
jgi:hypothetical protein